MGRGHHTSTPVPGSLREHDTDLLDRQDGISGTSSDTSCRPLRSRISDLRCDLQITVRELQGALLIWFFNTLLCVSIWCEHGSGIGGGIDPA
jgi:hypothetical protein